MAGERLYTRIPPSSTGNRIALDYSIALPYTNLYGGEAFEPNEYYLLLTSSVTIHVHKVLTVTSTTGYIFCSVDSSSEWNATSIITGETIRRIYDSFDIALVGDTTNSQEIYYNKTTLVGKANPEFGLDVDRTGSANIRFSEGRPQLDSFGKLRVAGATNFGDYTFGNDILPTKFSSKFNGSSSISWDSTKKALLLTNSTTTGESTTHTSNTYHHYIPGSSHLFLCTVAIGDTGKTNVVRNWGLFDEYNGFMFRLSGTTFQVVIRSNVQGSVNETIVSQTSFNLDTLDGSLDESTNPSGMNIDLSNINIFWIDVQWLGAGRVRFGTYNNGERITIHEYQHNNRYPYPLSATASLPVCFSQINTGTAGSTSEMRCWCTGVWSESNIDITTLGTPGDAAFSAVISNVASGYTYIGSLTPSIFKGTGTYNRSLYWPVDLETVAYDENGNDAMVEFKILMEPKLANLSLTACDAYDPGNSVYIDNNANYFGGGVTVGTTYTKNHTVVDLTNKFKSLSYGSFKNYSENGGTKIDYIGNITQANPAELTALLPILYHRETMEGSNAALTISSVSGMTEINNQNVYLKLTSANTALLYSDESLTTPINSTGYSAYTSGGILSGDFGLRAYITIVAKVLSGATANINVNANFSWRELNQ